LRPSRRCRSSPTSTRNGGNAKSASTITEVERHYYSVPHTLLRESVWVRITARTDEVFHRGNRVAAHLRSSSEPWPTTLPFYAADRIPEFRKIIEAGRPTCRPTIFLTQGLEDTDHRGTTLAPVASTSAITSRANSCTCGFGFGHEMSGDAFPA